MGFFDKIRKLFGLDSRQPSDLKTDQMADTSVSAQSNDTHEPNEVGNQHLSDTLVQRHSVEEAPIFHKSTSSDYNVNSGVDNRNPVNNPPVSVTPEDTSSKLDELEVLKAAEEERKKREWLDFMRAKRAKRRKELEEELELIDKKLQVVSEQIAIIKDERKSISKSSVPSFQVNTFEVNWQNQSSIFQALPPMVITSMAELEENRLEEARRQIEAAEKKAQETISGIRTAIRNRNLDEAKEGLDYLAQQVTYIENQEIRDKVKDIVLAVTELRNQIEEEKRAKEEEKRRKEALEAKLRAEQLERERVEKEQNLQREEEEKRERARKYLEELQAKEEVERRELQKLESLSKSLKEDEDDIEDFLLENGVQYFYHFTEASNIPLIKQRKGLFSWFYMENHGMKIPYPGGNEQSRKLDQNKGLEDYVRLSLCESHPMAYRIHQENNGKIKMVLLKIKIDVAKFESTLFTDINATDNNVKIGDDFEFIQKGFNFDAINLKWCYGTDPRHKKRQAEVLVKTFIPAEYIVNLDNPEIMTFNN